MPKYSSYLSDYHLSVSRDKNTDKWLRLHASSDYCSQITRRHHEEVWSPASSPTWPTLHLQQAKPPAPEFTDSGLPLLRAGRLASATHALSTTEFIVSIPVLSHTWLAFQHTRRSAPEINSGLPLSRAGRLTSQPFTTEDHPLDTLTLERDPAYHL